MVCVAPVWQLRSIFKKDIRMVSFFDRNFSFQSRVRVQRHQSCSLICESNACSFVVFNL